MITLTVSEAFAYDMLSIANIKLSHNGADRGAIKTFDKLHQEIVRQVGSKTHDAICHSDESKKLYEVNELMYHFINEMKTREPRVGDAQYVDSLVYKRFLAKKELQSKWFPGSELTEQKFGYNQGVKMEENGLDNKGRTE